MASPYDSTFFADIANGALTSARKAVPLIVELLGPRSVIDVGCGEGSWLSVFHALGVTDITGVDGEWVPRTMLRIPQERFVAADFVRGYKADRMYDLAVTLEVGEHLPPDKSESFVKTLASLAPAVVFSAAIPNQGGNDHTNERWPEEWARMFASQGYQAVDCFRRRLWTDGQIEWWYIQNMILFATPERIRASPALVEAHRQTDPNALSIVHPRAFSTVVVMHKHPSVKMAVSKLSGSLKRSVARRMGST